MPRKEFEMTDKQLQKLKDACKPVPYMIIGDYLPRSPRENAEAAWQQLGEELGFKWMTAEPVPDKDVKFFSAEVKGD